MTEQCKNCGAELFVGARFCRACGRPSEEISDENAPTRKMEPQQAETWGARGAAQTAPASGPNTSPVYAPPGTYQPSVPPPYAQPIPPYQAPQRRSPLGWIVAALCTGLFVVLIVGIMFISRRPKNPGFGGPGPRGGPTLKSDEAALDETTAEQVDLLSDETAMVKTFPVDEDTQFSIQNVSGSITIETWDKEQAQVKVIKRGGSESDRRATAVVFSARDNKLAFRTPSGKNYAEVRYEVKLPREVAKIRISTVNGSIKLSNVRADISVDSVNGAIALGDVAGLRNVKTVSGNVSAVLQDKLDDTPMEFITTSGNVDLQIKYDLNANLNAETVSGAISIDDSFGVSVEKKIPGQRAAGKIGEGGESLKIKTVSGNVKISK